MAQFVVLLDVDGEIPTRDHRKRRRIAAEQDWLCWWCGVEMIDSQDQAERLRVTIEHLVPAARGGSGALCNLVTSHSACNHKRRTSLAWRPHALLRSTERWRRLMEYTASALPARFRSYGADASGGIFSASPCGVP